MSEKSRDNHNRWRSLTIGFRVSPEENEQINRMVRMSGLTKQDYLTANMLHHNIIVKSGPRVYKGLREEMKLLAAELERLSCTDAIDDELQALIRTALEIFAGLYEGTKSGKNSRNDEVRHEHT